MRFVLEKYLTEDIEAVKNRYPDIDDTTFDTALKADPTYKEGSNSVGRYTKWILNILNNELKRNDGIKINTMRYLKGNVKDALTEFERYKSSMSNRDIGQFKSFEELVEFVSTLSNDVLTDRQKERRLRNAYNDAKLLFSDGKWEVWTPLSYAGSCTLGKGTSWCTAYSENDAYYKHYSSEGTLYVLINKQNPKDKYQFHFESAQFMDVEDKSINSNEYSHIFEDAELLDYFMGVCFKDTTEDYISVSVDDYDDALYNYEAVGSHSLSSETINNYINELKYGDSSLLDEYFDNYYVSNLNGWDVSRYLNSENEEILCRIYGVDSLQYVDYSSNEDIEGLLVMSLNDGCAYGAYDDCVKLIDSSIQEAWGRVTGDFETGITDFNIPVDTVKHRVFKYIILGEYEPIDIFNDDLKNAIWNMWLAEFNPQYPYYGFSGFDEDAFNDTLSSYLPNLEDLDTEE